LERLFDDVDVESAVMEEVRSSEPECDEISAELKDAERWSQMAGVALLEFADPSVREWDEGPFGWIRRAPSSSKRGRIGEALVRSWACGEGLRVDEPEHRGYDCAIEGLRVEVKTSLRWNSGRFVFLQLRDFSYEAIALLAVEPTEVHLWIVPKRVMWECARRQKRGVSHHGSKWVSFIVGETPDWLRPWGGSLTRAREAVRTIGEERRGWAAERLLMETELEVCSQASAPVASAF
jgi:hypothetical protein